MSMAQGTDMPRHLPARHAGAAPALTLAGIAALLASSCCVLPLVFALVGISGAWIVHMRVFEAYTPLLIGLALLATALAGWRLYRPAAPARQACADATACPARLRSARRWFWLVALLTLVPLVVPAMAPLFY